MPNITELEPVVEWKNRLMELEAGMVRHSPVVEYIQRQTYGYNEVGIMHPINKSKIKVYDSGNIELFADRTLGILIDKTSQGIEIFGNTTDIISRNINMYTTPNGLTWNGYYLNPTLYIKEGRGIPYEDKNLRLSAVCDRWDPLEGRYVPTAIYIKPFVRKPASTIYDDSLKDLLTQLNIPI